jgi:aspartyl-tRNA(Asn)/glutamyl-tRNA(Gln) amidotransferase subunit C
MEPNEIDVNYVAQLARLQISEEEEKMFQSQLAQILAHVQQLSSLNLDGIEPTAHAAPQWNVFRPDEVGASLPVEEALKNAPQAMNDLFRVTKVVE